MHPDAVVQTHVDARRRLVDVTAAERDEAHREFAQPLVVELEGGLTQQARTAVDPQPIHPVDEDIRHIRVGDERRQLAELGQVAAGRPVDARTGWAGDETRLEHAATLTASGAS